MELWFKFNRSSEELPNNEYEDSTGAKHDVGKQIGMIWHLTSNAIAWTDSTVSNWWKIKNIAAYSRDTLAINIQDATVRAFQVDFEAQNCYGVSASLHGMGLLFATSVPTEKAVRAFRSIGISYETTGLAFGMRVDCYTTTEQAFRTSHVVGCEGLQLGDAIAGGFRTSGFAGTHTAPLYENCYAYAGYNGVASATSVAPFNVDGTDAKAEFVRCIAEGGKLPYSEDAAAGQVSSECLRYSTGAPATAVTGWTIEDNTPIKWWPRIHALSATIGAATDFSADNILDLLGRAMTDDIGPEQHNADEEPGAPGLLDSEGQGLTYGPDGDGTGGGGGASSLSLTL